ncbi:Hypothetical protein PENO1_039410 [Penicillium occitanis (nom. inval.)]|nr:Hypothetical protein PENO1_039410 [Penicillium occitanis (nom. inval.)]PCH10154.1 hypothetical protein PENOC_004180 [Penicillium occitanis (nom. inval.)]
MTPVAIITVLFGVIALVQGLEITRPKAGDKIDLRQGLTTEWIVEDNDNLHATVAIELYWNSGWLITLTQWEADGTVPINDSSYTFQYTPDKKYIPAKTDYVLYLYDGTDTEHKTGKFEIFNTDSRVTSTISKPTATQKGPKKSPSASASVSVMLNSSSTRLPHHTPSASSGRANGLTDDSITTGTVGLIFIGEPLFWGLILVYVQGGLIWT